MQSIEEQPYVQVRAEYRAEEPLAASFLRPKKAFSCRSER
jgi:hypothetical protein